MQTRKRNIDSVLNLVNPKRIKQQNSSQKPKVKEKTFNNENKRGKEGQHLLAKKDKVDRTDKTKVDLEVGKVSQTKEEINPKKVNTQVDNTNHQITDKPLKKRPLNKDNERKSDPKNSNVKTDIEIVILVKDDTIDDLNNQNASLQNQEEFDIKNEVLDDDQEVLNHCQTESDNSHSNVTRTVTDDLPKGDGEVTHSRTEDIFNKNSNVTTNFKQEKYAEAESHSDKIDGTKEDVCVKSEDEESDNDDDDDDDEFIDSGAIDDDRDGDFVVPRTDPDEASTNPLVKKAKRIVKVGAFEVTLDRKIDNNHTMNDSQPPQRTETDMNDTEKPFTCDKCNKSFSKKSYLDAHQVVHQEGKPFSCPVCMKQFKREISLNHHYKVHEEGKTFICHHCGLSFGFMSSLAGHLKTHSEEKPYECTTCGKGFYSKQSYLDHNLRHEKIKDIVCTICNRRYYNKKELRKHMGFHLKVTDFHCEPCKMYFSDTHSLRIHRVKAHAAEYNCEFCGIKFYNRRALNTHIFREHREMRNSLRPKMAMQDKANFKHVLCDFCGKELSNKYRLKKHLIAKHSGKKMVRRPPDPKREPPKLFPSLMKVLCTICNKVMYNKYKLYTHMQKIHDVPEEDLKNIKLVNIEREVKTIKRDSFEKDSDGQTIVIKPMDVDSSGVIHLPEQGGQYGRRTIHYLDAHGNIIYTDVSSDKRVIKNYYENNDDSQLKAAQSVHHINNTKPGIDGTITDGSKDVSSIVDYAAKAAQIFDGDQDVLTIETNSEGRLFNENDEEIIIFNKPSSEIGTESSSDITYIVEQATNRIAAHEKSVDSKTAFNISGSNLAENDARLVVNENGIQDIVNNEEGVEYVIGEVDGNLSTGEVGYLVKEGLNEILDNEIVMEGCEGDQEQKIIIIDENGGEQIISTGSNDLIKITYDPDTGLYSYVAEEVEIKQEDSGATDEKSLDSLGYNTMVIVDENNQPILDQDGAGVDVSNETDKLPADGPDVLNQNKELKVEAKDIHDNQLSTHLDSSASLQYNAVVSDTKLQNDKIQTTVESIANAMSLATQQDGTIASKNVTSSEIVLQSSKCEEVIEAPKTNVLHSNFETSFHYESLQPSHRSESVIESTNILQTTSTMPSLTSYIHQPHQQMQYYSGDSNLTKVNQALEPNQMLELEDISESVLILDQTQVPLPTDFQNSNYTRSILQDAQVSNPAAHRYTVDANTYENVSHTYRQTGGQYFEQGIPVTDSINVTEGDIGDKRNLAQLENMLKSGIKDASNTEEYTNFLDRMINHLQSAKDNVVGQPSLDK